MAIIDEITANRSYPLPNVANDLVDDVERLRDALSGIDTDVAAMLIAIAGKAALVHGHDLSDVSGLISALAGKSNVGHTHDLSALNGVNISGAANGQFFKRVSGVWVPASIAISDVTNLQASLDAERPMNNITGLIDALNAKASLKSSSIIIPRGTTAQRPSGTGSESLIRFNTTTASFEGWNGASWGKIGGGAPTGSSPPSPAQDGDLWWSRDLAILFIYYDDGDTQQWVSTNVGADPNLILLRSNNLSDIANKPAAMTNLGISTFMQGVLAALSGDAAFTALGAAKLHAQSGYQKLPSGLIIQWGFNGSGVQDPNFALPIAFPTAHVMAVASLSVAGFAPNDAFAAIVYSRGLSTLGVAQRYIGSGAVSSNPYPFSWLAIGY